MYVCVCVCVCVRVHEILKAGNPDPPPRPTLYSRTDSILHIKWLPANPFVSDIYFVLLSKTMVRATGKKHLYDACRCGAPVDGYELQQREIRVSDTTGKSAAEVWALAEWVTIAANFQTCEYISCDNSSLFKYKFRVRAHNFEGWSGWSRVSLEMQTRRRH